jgi:hypothetical protein
MIISHITKENVPTRWGTTGETSAAGLLQTARTRRVGDDLILPQLLDGQTIFVGVAFHSQSPRQVACDINQSLVAHRHVSL